MSIYWNSFTIMFVNQTSSDLTLGTPNIISGTVQSASSVPKKTGPPGLNAFFGRSYSDSTSGASGYAKWTTNDGVVCSVYYSAPNAGDPSGLPTLDGINAGNYSFQKGNITCSGDGCDINSGNRNYTMTVTLRSEDSGDDDRPCSARRSWDVKNGYASGVLSAPIALVRPTATEENVPTSAHA